MTHNADRHYTSLAADAGAKSVRDSCNLICLPGYSGSRGSTSSSSSSSVLHKFQHRRRRCLLLLPSFKWFTLFGLKVYQLGKCIYLIHTQTGASDWQTEQARQGKAGKARQTSLRTQADMLTDRRGDRHTDSQTIRPTLRLDKELELELEQWRLGAEIKWLRARGNATLKRSFYAIFKSLSAATQALPSPPTPPPSVCALALQAFVCVFVRAYVFVYNCRRSSLARESVYNFGLNNKTL